MNDESTEKLSPTEEIVISEDIPTVHEDSLINKSDPEFLQKFGEMNFDQRLEAFRTLESRYAETEGRYPRLVSFFEGTENDDAFRISKGKLEINKTCLERMETFDDRTLSEIKNRYFSDLDTDLNEQKPISFAREGEEKRIDNMAMENQRLSNALRFEMEARHIDTQIRILESRIRSAEEAKDYRHARRLEEEKRQLDDRYHQLIMDLLDANETRL